MVFCVSCVAAYGHVVNDWFDITEDESRKPNTMRNVPVSRRAALCFACIVAPFIALSFLPDQWLARTVLAFNFLWLTLYSVPFVRLKERGRLGVIADAAGSHITPTIFAFALTVAFVACWAGMLVIGAVLLWATVLGIKGILYHQISDRASDEKAGVATYAATLDFATLSSALTRYNLLVELPVRAFFTVVIGACCPLAIVALLISIARGSTKPCF